MTKILGYDFEIIYRKGNKNVVTNALSKKYEDAEELIYSISIIQPYWIAKARDAWKNDEEIWTFIQTLQHDPSASNPFMWKDDFLW